jgi:hypothetical protein
MITYFVDALPLSTVNTEARCEDFDSTQCIGTVFYNGTKIVTSIDFGSVRKSNV